MSATPAEIRRHTMREVGRLGIGTYPAFVIGLSRGLLIVSGKDIATLDPSLGGYTGVFATYRDTTGEWLVIGGKNGVIMLPASVIKTSLSAVSPN